MAWMGGSTRKQIDFSGVHITFLLCFFAKKKGYTKHKIYTNKCRCHLRKHNVDTNQSQMSTYVYPIALLLLIKPKSK